MYFQGYLAAFRWYEILAVFSFLLGACIGSFLNVCIYRIPRNISVITPRSYCPKCNAAIPWYLNIPLLSFIILRAKCRFCGAGISARYFIVELLTAVLFLFVWLKFSLLHPSRPMGLVPLSDIRLVPAYWVFVSGLILGTFVDFERLIIPDRVTLGGIFTGLALSAAFPSLHGESTCIRGILWSSLGALAGWFSLWATAIIGKALLRKDAMGFGDVKLLGAIGAFLGSKAVLFTMLVSSLTGSIVGISLVLAGRKKMQSRIPYGPHLALAAAIWVLWGPKMWDAYCRFLSPARELPAPANLYKLK